MENHREAIQDAQMAPGVTDEELQLLRTWAQGVDSRTSVYRDAIEALETPETGATYNADDTRKARERCAAFIADNARKWRERDTQYCIRATPDAQQCARCFHPIGSQFTCPRAR